jgi:hypothetical protein
MARFRLLFGSHSQGDLIWSANNRLGLHPIVEADHDLTRMFPGKFSYCEDTDTEPADPGRPIKAAPDYSMPKVAAKK